MTVFTRNVEVDIKGDVGMMDVTSLAMDAVSKSGIKNGTVTCFVPGSTGAISTIEYEPGLLKDVPRALEVIAPSDIDYEHHKTWHDDNGKGHVRATIIGPSLVVPFTDGNLILGTWQQIVFMNLDSFSRKRRLVFQVMGE